MTAPVFPPLPSRTSRTTRAVSARRHTTSPKAAPKMRYAVATLAGIFAILGGQLLLSISVSSGAYTIADLKSDVRTSEQSLQIVAEDIGALTAPDTLASLAGSMGMVEDNNPAYLRISDGAVLGEAAPADSASETPVYTVTAGTEDRVPPKIVYDVSALLTAQVTSEVSAEEALLAATIPVAHNTGSAVVSSATVTTPTRVAVGTFGGSIPSPTTR
ncbi:MAG: hypothetical protein ACJAV4_001225 [Pontimonas sp.]|jgi:hypothetical protein